MTAFAPPLPPPDGRSARALRTREAIVDACIGLVEEGELRPTAPRVAERAGVSVRSVFQHFDDLPSLHIAVSERIVARLAVLLHPIDPSMPLDDRIVAFVRRPDYAELSATLGMPQGSIGPTRGRCLDKLRQELTLAGGL